MTNIEALMCLIIEGQQTTNMLLGSLASRHPFMSDDDRQLVTNTVKLIERNVDGYKNLLNIMKGEER